MLLLLRSLGKVKQKSHPILLTAPEGAHNQLSHDCVTYQPTYALLHMHPFTHLSSHSFICPFTTHLLLPHIVGHLSRHIPTHLHLSICMPTHSHIYPFMFSSMHLSPPPYAYTDPDVIFSIHIVITLPFIHLFTHSVIKSFNYMPSRTFYSSKTYI